MNGHDYWTNPPIDKMLHITAKYYPRFCAPYSHDRLHEMSAAWTLTACLCTDKKFYVINRHTYNGLSPKQFNQERIGPYDTLDAALLAAAILDGRSI